MTPRRLALLIAALFCLSTAVALGLARYPDQDTSVSVDRARAFRDANPLATSASCFEDAVDPDRPCIVIHLENFPARARVIASGILPAMLLSGLAFRRAYDGARVGVRTDG